LCYQKEKIFSKKKTNDKFESVLLMDLKRSADELFGQEKKFKFDALQFSSSHDIDRLGDSHFLGLPREITLTIFSYFDHHDLCSLSSVCKSTPFVSLTLFRLVSSLWRSTVVEKSLFAEMALR
jgi:hypothetical protein